MAVRKEDVEFASPADGARVFIPLNRLKKSPKNIRKVPHASTFIHSLAATIHAHVRIPAILNGHSTRW